MIEIDGENLYDTFADLWVKANCIYDVDDFSVLEGAGPCDLGIGPEFYEIPNYDTAVPAVFYPEGDRTAGAGNDRQQCRHIDPEKGWQKYIAWDLGKPDILIKMRWKIFA